MGGVLEHPAWSRLWHLFALPWPDALPDAFGGFTVQVDQVNWGHVARKRTWLYIVGVPRGVVLNGLRIGATPTHWIAGARRRRIRSGGLVPPGIKICSAQQRRRTPPAMAAWLIELAASARRPELRACG